MTVKIYKRWKHPFAGWLPYVLLRTENISPEEYAKIHDKSDYADYEYEIL